MRRPESPATPTSARNDSARLMSLNTGRRKRATLTHTSNNPNPPKTTRDNLTLTVSMIYMHAAIVGGIKDQPSGWRANRRGHLHAPARKRLTVSC